jgi:hypothetical protein
MKDKHSYTKEEREKYFSSVSSKRLLTIKRYIKVGYNLTDLMSTYNLSKDQAIFFYLMFEPTKKKEAHSLLGNKKEPYYDGEFPSELPEYTVDDLEGEELEILKGLENGQNEGDLYQHY